VHDLRADKNGLTRENPAAARSQSAVGIAASYNISVAHKFVKRSFKTDRHNDNYVKLESKKKKNYFSWIIYYENYRVIAPHVGIHKFT